MESKLQLEEGFVNFFFELKVSCVEVVCVFQWDGDCLFCIQIGIFFRNFN